MGRLAAHTTPTRCRRRLNLATAALQQLGLANLLVAPAAPARHIPRWRRSDNWCDGGRCDGGEWCSSGRRGGRRCSKRSGALTLLAAAAQSLQPVLLAFGLTLRELSLELVHLDEVGRARGRGRVCAGAEVSVGGVCGRGGGARGGSGDWGGGESDLALDLSAELVALVQLPARRLLRRVDARELSVDARVEIVQDVERLAPADELLKIDRS